MEKYYVSGCKGQDDDIVTCGDDEAQFWTIYQRDLMGLSQGLVDFTFREDAEAAMKVYVERDALQQKLDAALAESEKNLKGANAWEDKAKTIATENLAIRTYLSSGSEEVKISHPETDAILNEVRAEGALAASAKIHKAIHAFKDVHFCAVKECADIAEMVADELRTGSKEGGE